MNDGHGTTSSDTLQGWKEIANHLGRSTRAVQRWERELGLPVHRIKTADGQTVYAQKAELDEWRKSRDLPKPTAEEVAEVVAAATAPGGTAEPVADAHQNPPPSPGWRTLALAAVLILVSGIWIGQHLKAPGPPVGPITKFEFVGRSMIALDAKSQVVWNHDFGRQVSRADDGLGTLTGGYEVPATSDDTIVVAVRLSPAGGQQTESDVIMGFDRSGNIKWQVTPKLTLSCGSEDFAGPWSVSAMTFGHDADSKVYVAFRNHTWWPSMLLEIDKSGKDRLIYLQTGWIRAMAEWQSTQGRLLAVGGVYNEFEQPSTTLIDPAGPPVMSPHTAARFNCTGTPAGQAVAAYLWPTLDVRAESAYPMNTTVLALDNGLRIQLEETGGDAIGELNNDLSVRSFSLADNYWVVHRRREADGYITHTAEKCPERTRPQPISIWKPQTGWVETTMVPTVRQTERAATMK